MNGKMGQAVKAVGRWGAGAILLTMLALPWSQAAANNTQQIENCDLFAAHPFDPKKRAAGTTYTQLQPNAAIYSCNAAILSQPNEGRLHFQLGRALEKANQLQQAIAAYQRAAQLGHGGGYSNLGELYRDGKGFPRNQQLAEQNFRQGAANGYPEALFNLAELLLKQSRSDDNVNQARQLLQASASSGFPDASKLLASLPRDTAAELQRQSEPPAVAPISSQQGVNSVATAKYIAMSSTAMAITGDIIVSANRITFQNGKSVDVQSAGQVDSYKSSMTKKPVTARLLKAIVPADPPLLQGNKICGGTSITYIAVYELPADAYSPKPSQVVDVFNGNHPPKSSDAPGACGVFSYELKKQASVVAQSSQPAQATWPPSLQGVWQVPVPNKSLCGQVDIEQLEIRDGTLTYGMPPISCTLASPFITNNGMMQATLTCESDSQCVGGGCNNSKVRTQQKTIKISNTKILFENISYVRNACPL